MLHTVFSPQFKFGMTLLLLYVLLKCSTKGSTRPSGVSVPTPDHFEEAHTRWRGVTKGCGNNWALLKGFNSAQYYLKSLNLTHLTRLNTVTLSSCLSRAELCVTRDVQRTKEKQTNTKLETSVCFKLQFKVDVTPVVWFICSRLRTKSRLEGLGLGLQLFLVCFVFNQKLLLWSHMDWQATHLLDLMMSSCIISNCPNNNNNQVETGFIIS